MGLRFRKRIHLAPGINLNLSKRGTSFSAGGPGATVNFSDRGMRTTVGIPGTGLSYSSTRRPRRRAGVISTIIFLLIVYAFIHALLH